jgi:hypothetical protein
MTRQPSNERVVQQATPSTKRATVSQVELSAAWFLIRSTLDNCKHQLVLSKKCQQGLSQQWLGYHHMFNTGQLQTSNATLEASAVMLLRQLISQQ